MGIPQEKPSLSRSRANAHVYTKRTLQLSWPICFLLFAGMAPTPEAEQTWGHRSARSHVGRGARGRRRAGMSLLALPYHTLAVTSSCPLGGSWSTSEDTMWPFWDLFWKDMNKGGGKSISQTYSYAKNCMALVFMSCTHELFCLSSEGQTVLSWLSWAAIWIMKKNNEQPSPVWLTLFLEHHCHCPKSVHQTMAEGVKFSGEVYGH